MPSLDFRSGPGRKPQTRNSPKHLRQQHHMEVDILFPPTLKHSWSWKIPSALQKFSGSYFLEAL
eukprot:958232-Amphidinium_carterae.1